MRINPAQLIISLLLLSCIAIPSSASIDHPVILELLPNPATSGDRGEYLVIYNPTNQRMNISGFVITDLEGRITVPPCTYLPPGSSYRIDLPSCGVALKNSGDEVLLLDRNGKILDCVIYGDSDYEGEGWSGGGLGKARENRIFRRFYLNEDTDTAYEWLPLREYYLGQSNFMPPVRSVSCNITAFVSPDSSLEVLTGEIMNASIIRASVYTFESYEIERALIDTLDRGGTVYLLLEQDPVGGVSELELDLIREIAARGGHVRFADTTLYSLHHAKYALIDDDTVIISSENWNDGGFPPPGFAGNRGWGAVIRSEEIFSDLLSVFEYDWGHGIDLKVEELPEGVVNRDKKIFSRHRRSFDPIDINGSFRMELIIAPDNSLNYDTIIRMIESANETLYIEQAYIRRGWEECENPYLEAAIDAARRGVEVKILVDSMWYHLDGRDDNDELCRYVNGIARREGLNLEAKLAVLDGIRKIHNKGVIVDGKKVLISSINWNRHSPTYNREIGIIIENPDLGRYYSDVFLDDWNRGRISLKMVIILIIMIFLLLSSIYLLRRWMSAP
ncbi:MAG: hypothetical protein CW694_06270 [Candidatus Syntrophoarchaeum sp. WYZ-LMO15]|nr:MAG: hypothetical protein CW694_06270 [Candidatus Syntrophoarchaeum sp. WYZ-LMO15]